MKCKWHLCLISVFVLLNSIAWANEVFNVKDNGAVGDGLENITITGGGVIEGKFGLTRYSGPAGTGGRIMAFQRCKNLKITNVSLRHGAHTTLHLKSVDGIELGNMKVESFWDLDPNGGGHGRDGAIFYGCQKVLIYDSVFKGSDDAFSFKSRQRLPHGERELQDRTLHVRLALVQRDPVRFGNAHRLSQHRDCGFKD